MVNKALPIAEALYPSYSLFFLFDNTTSHPMFAQDALCITQMNKGTGGQQSWLYNGWFEKDGAHIIQPMSFQKEDGTWYQKGIQKVLEKQTFWPQRGLKLECPKPKYFNCEVMVNCKDCIKGHRYDICKAPNNHSSSNCLKIQKCDSCAYQKSICQCMTKKSCAIYCKKEFARTRTWSRAGLVTCRFGHVRLQGCSA